MVTFVSGAHFVAVLWIFMYCMCFKVTTEYLALVTSLRDDLLSLLNWLECKVIFNQNCPVSSDSLNRDTLATDTKHYFDKNNVRLLHGLVSCPKQVMDLHTRLTFSITSKPFILHWLLKLSEDYDQCRLFCFVCFIPWNLNLNSAVWQCIVLFYIIDFQWDQKGSVIWMALAYAAYSTTTQENWTIQCGC